MATDGGPESGVKGIAEDLKGKAKEVIGEVTGDGSKEREGRAQQDKAQSSARLRSMKPRLIAVLFLNRP